MAAQTGRCDLAAVMRVIGVLLARPAADEAVDAGLDALRSKLDETGVHFLGIDDAVRLPHGRSGRREPERAKLGEIRQAWWKMSWVSPPVAGFAARLADSSASPKASGPGDTRDPRPAGMRSEEPGAGRPIRRTCSSASLGR
jgi:hypothetical protein